MSATEIRFREIPVLHCVPLSGGDCSNLRVGRLASNRCLGHEPERRSGVAVAVCSGRANCADDVNALRGIPLITDSQSLSARPPACPVEPNEVWAATNSNSLKVDTFEEKGTGFHMRRFFGGSFVYGRCVTPRSEPFIISLCPLTLSSRSKLRMYVTFTGRNQFPR